jgi:mono/diheme cytochrome c family protein
MPALHFTDAEIAAMRAFLVEIDRPDIGRGQLRLGDPAAGTSPQSAFEASVRAASPPAEVGAGFEKLRTGICGACHFPFQVSTVQAPDLSTVVERLDDAELREVLVSGRPENGMPPPVPAFSGAEIDQVVAYLRWLNQNRASLESDSRAREAQRDVDWSKLPWWEFE